MLTLYKRHYPPCTQTDRNYKRCKCPVWVEGVEEQTGRYIRHSLKTRSFANAQDLIYRKQNVQESVSVKEGLKAFVEDCVGRRLAEPTLRKYRLLQKQLAEFAASLGVHQLSGLDAALLRRFREQRHLGARTAGKELERLRAFFRFCYDSGWIQKNPAAALKAPKVTLKPTLPFKDEEVARMREKASGRLLIFLNVLLETGLRIGDAALLHKERIQDGSLFLYTAKTGTPVWLPLPPYLLAELQGIETSGHYFLRGESTSMHTVADLWRRDLNELFGDCGIENGHPHRFRDTFAVRFLRNGTSIETVSILLGHQDIKVTQKHYAPWVLERQIHLESEVRRAWQNQARPVLVKR